MQTLVANGGTTIDGGTPQRRDNLLEIQIRDLLRSDDILKYTAKKQTVLKEQ